MTFCRLSISLAVFYMELCMYLYVGGWHHSKKRALLWCNPIFHFTHSVGSPSDCQCFRHLHCWSRPTYSLMCTFCIFLSMGSPLPLPPKGPFLPTETLCFTNNQSVSNILYVNVWGPTISDTFCYKMFFWWIHTGLTQLKWLINLWTQNWKKTRAKANKCDIHSTPPIRLKKKHNFFHCSW